MDTEAVTNRLSLSASDNDLVRRRPHASRARNHVALGRTSAINGRHGQKLTLWGRPVVAHKAAVEVWMLDLASSLWLDLVQTLMDWTDQHCRSSHRLMRCRTLHAEMVASAALVESNRSDFCKRTDHARSFRFRDQL